MTQKLDENHLNRVKLKNIHTFIHRADQQADQLYDDGCGSSSKLPLIINMQNIQQHLDNNQNTFKKITRGATETRRSKQNIKHNCCIKCNVLSNQNRICLVNLDPRSPAPANILKRTVIFQGQVYVLNSNILLENGYFSTLSRVLKSNYFILIFVCCLLVSHTRYGVDPSYC